MPACVAALGKRYGIGAYCELPSPGDGPYGKSSRCASRSPLSRHEFRRAAVSCQRRQSHAREFGLFGKVSHGVLSPGCAANCGSLAGSIFTLLAGNDQIGNSRCAGHVCQRRFLLPHRSRSSQPLVFRCRQKACSSVFPLRSTVQIFCCACPSTRLLLLWSGPANNSEFRVRKRWTKV